MNPADHRIPNQHNPPLSPGLKALSHGLRLAFVGLSLALAAFLTWYIAFEGFFRVNPGEVALVLKMGELSSPYPEGTRWTFPYPISRVIKLPTHQLSFNYRELAGSDLLYFAQSTAATRIDNPNPNSEPIPTAVLSSYKDGYMLSADNNILFSEWTIIYHISNPQECFVNLLGKDNSGNPELIRQTLVKYLKPLLECAITQVTANLPVDQVYPADAWTPYADAVRNRLQRQVDQLIYGLTIDQTIVKVVPPKGPDRAFKSVLDARQNADKRLKDAEEFAVVVGASAHIEAAQTIATAKAYQQQRIATGNAASTVFNQLLPQYQANPDLIRTQLVQQTLANSLSSVKDVFILGSDAGQRQIRLKVNPVPTGIDPDPQTKEDTNPQ